MGLTSCLSTFLESLSDHLSVPFQTTSITAWVTGSEPAPVLETQDSLNSTQSTKPQALKPEWLMRLLGGLETAKTEPHVRGAQGFAFWETENF